MGESEALSMGISIDYEACSTCSLCVYACPFEAISVKQLEDKRKVSIDDSKCRFCGLCYSLCPLDAIKINYFDLEELTDKARKLCSEFGTRGLTVACKGSNPTNAAINKRISDSNSPILKVPCLGRVPLDFYAKLLASGDVQSLNVLPCEEDFCRLKEGGRMTFLRVDYLKSLLGELGADSRQLNVVTSENKAQVDEAKCIGCGNCVHYCPYEAPSIRSPGIASIDEEKCMGCGICLSYCPNYAITLEGYDHKDLVDATSKLSEKVGSQSPIVVFHCQWAYTPKPSAESAPNTCFIELPCAGRADPIHVIQALNQGFAGAIVLACRKDMCNFEEAGAKRAEENLGALKRLLGQLGLGEKVEVAFVSPKYAGEADQAISSFKSKIRG